MFRQESYPTSEISEKIKNAAKALGLTALAGVTAAAALGLAYEGSKSAGPAQPTPLERTLDNYPGVVNQSPGAGAEQIAVAGDWKAQHPEVSKILIEDVSAAPGHDAEGNMAEEGQSKVRVTMSNGKVIEMTGFGEQSYNGSGIPSLDKKITHLEEKIGMSPSGSAIPAAEDDAIIDALNSTVQ